MELRQDFHQDGRIECCQVFGLLAVQLILLGRDQESNDLIKYAVSEM
ncbi:MAG: hypothetical protein P8074_22575 [Anaerolineales bacterium]